jgi:hypothetical protein
MRVHISDTRLTIGPGKSVITLFWALQLEKIVDDGFATAVALTSIHPGLDSSRECHSQSATIAESGTDRLYQE